jgi:hypothetical protein
MNRKEISKFMPPAARGAFLKNRPPGPPEKLLFRKKGKILRIKQGYNPNSSSMGSIVFVLPAILFVITVIFGALSGILSTIFMRNIDNPEKKTGRLYLKLQNTFYKKKMKEHLK